MKNSLPAVLLAALVLSGCGRREEAPPAMQEAAAQNAGTVETEQATTQTAQTPTAEEPGRAETMELEFMLEGRMTTVPATLQTGQGYSIYIPNEGWRMEKDTEDGFPEEIWESTANDDAELRVLHLQGKSLEEAQAFIMAEEDDYQFQENKQGGLLGTDERDRDMMEVRFHPAGDMMYAVLYTYPEEAMEGFGVRLSVMADTFETAS